MDGEAISKPDAGRSKPILFRLRDRSSYIMPIAGEDNLVIGTDYGHADSATELNALNGVLKNSR
jgi:hypothetical protein